MRGRLIDLTRGMNGRQRITVELDEDFREGYQALRESDVELKLAKWRKKRSLDANGYAWVLIDRIAAEIGAKKEEVYRLAIREIGGVSDTVCVLDSAVDKLCESWKKQGLGWQAETLPSRLAGCTNVVLYYGSSTYNTEQMSRLIENLVQDAKLLGIETLSPEKLAAMTIKEG